MAKISSDTIKKILLFIGKICTILGGGAIGGALFSLAIVGWLAGYDNFHQMFNF